MEVQRAEPRPGRDEAVAVLYARYRSGLVRLAVGLLGDLQDAEEVVQDAFAGLLRRWSALRDVDAASGYLHAAVVNGARARWRRQRVRRLADAALRRPTVVIEPDVLQQSVVLAAVARLSLRKRACVLLRYYADFSERETADALGISVGTVKSQTSKALRQLALELEPEREGAPR